MELVGFLLGTFLVVTLFDMLMSCDRGMRSPVTAGAAGGGRGGRGSWFRIVPVWGKGNKNLEYVD